MKTRRQFAQGLIGGFAGAALAKVSGKGTQAATIQESIKKIRIGIIGAENSHTIGYGEIFNRDRKFPGCRECCASSVQDIAMLIRRMAGCSFMASIRFSA